jgi:hypothetical protein
MAEQCKLCLQNVASLEDSHFLSAGIYRVLRDEREKNPNPWLLTKTTAVQTSRQMTAPLLCRACEQHFSKYGENWVLGHCLRKDRSFPLASILASKTPDVSSDKTTTRIYYASTIPEINISALAYFAASIVWRGSIHPWNDDGSIPVRLGPFQEQFRQYLMGLESFPKDCSLSVVVREGKGKSPKHALATYDAAAFGELCESADTLEGIWAALPSGLQNALSFAIGGDVTAPWIEVRGEDAQLIRRFYYRMGRRMTEDGFGAFSPVNEFRPDSGIAQFLNAFFSTPTEKRDSLIVPLNLIRSGAPGSAN